MPRYFFDTNDGDLLAEDEDGVELRDDEAARDIAQAALPDMARDSLPNGEHHNFTVRVRNASGATVYSASLALNGQWHTPELS